MNRVFQPVQQQQSVRAKISEEDVQRLMVMGPWREESVREALLKHNGDAGEASLYLCSQPDAIYLPTPLSIALPNITTKVADIKLGGAKASTTTKEGKKVNTFGEAQASDDEDENGNENGDADGYDDAYQYEYDDNDYSNYDDDYNDGELSPSSDDQSPSPRFILPDFGQYKHLPVDELNAKCIEQSIKDTHISERDIAEPLLIANQWKVDTVISLYFDKDPKETLESCGLEKYDGSVIRARLSSSTQSKTGRQVDCKICYSSFDESDAFALNCDEWFCKEDYADYLNGRVANSSSAYNTFCPGYKCKSLVVPSVFEAFCTPVNFQKLKTAVLNNYISSSKDKKWCPGVNCSLVCIANHATSICCPCGSRSCFKCDDIDHAPALCNQLRLWKVKYDEEGLSALWIKQNTQKCPKCRVDIQKNQGCNHMTCRQEVGGCGFEFCWICLSDWRNHQACNKYVPTKAEDELDSTARLSHFFQRYEIQQNSERAATKARKEFQDRSSVSFESESDLNSLKKSHDLVIRCRIALKYSYVYGFFCYRDPLGKSTTSELHMGGPLKLATIKTFPLGTRMVFKKASAYQYSSACKDNEFVTLVSTNSANPPVQVRWDSSGHTYYVMAEDLRQVSQINLTHSTSSSSKPLIVSHLQQQQQQQQQQRSLPAPALTGRAFLGNLFGSSRPTATAAVEANVPSSTGVFGLKSAQQYQQQQSNPVDASSLSSSAKGGGASPSSSSSSSSGTGAGAGMPATPPRVPKELFEMHQEMLETSTEKLHHMLEQESLNMISIFNQLKVTEKFLEEIIKELRE